jgi:hypothetical protein
LRVSLGIRRTGWRKGGSAFFESSPNEEGTVARRGEVGKSKT